MWTDNRQCLGHFLVERIFYGVFICEPPDLFWWMQLPDSLLVLMGNSAQKILQEHPW